MVQQIGTTRRIM